MSIMGYYKRLRMIEKLCYKSNLKLVKKQEQQINKLATCIEQIKEIAEENDDLLRGYHKEWANNKLILQKISEVDIE